MPSPSSIWNPQVNTVDQELRSILQDNTNENYGAGYVAYDQQLAYPLGSAGAAIKKAQQDINNISVESTTGYSTFLNYGAVGDGVTLNDAAFIAALLDTDRLYIPNPAVCYLISQPINIAASNLRILGESRLLTKIRINNSSLPVFIIGPGLENIELSTLKIERSVPATATGTGVECTGLSSMNSFRDLNIENQWNGMLLGETESGQVVGCNIHNCYGNGIRQISGASQNLIWDVRDSRIYDNNGNGLDYEAQGTAADILLGSVDNVYSVYNTGYGLRAVGQVAKKLNSLRISGGVFSFNGNDGISLDTYGARHRISQLSANLQGLVTTGRNRATTASAAGAGIHVSPNNLEINIVGCVASENSYSGMRVEANLVSISGNTCTDNGKNTGATSAQRSGLRLTTGRIIAQGNTLTNRVAGAGTQQNGIHITDGVNCILDGNNCAGNMVNAIFVAGTSTTNRITGNAGYNPQAIDTVVPGASPWTYTAGGAPEFLYIKGGTISLLVSGGQTLASAASSATTYLLVPLEPNQAITLTYSAAPSIVRQKR